MIPAVLRKLRHRSGEGISRWARRRQGRDPASLRLASSRIYILPTGAGLIYALLLATMLAGAMNYSNNLGMALTFVLAGLGIAGIYHSHSLLCGLQLDALGAEPVFAGDALRVRFQISDRDGQARREIFLDWSGEEPVAGGVPASGSRIVELPLATRQRGWITLPRLRLETRAPLGLVRAWCWIHMDLRLIVYPRPAPLPVNHPASRVHSGRPQSGRQRADAWSGLRDYRPGDPPRRIIWRRYAAGDGLLVPEELGTTAGDPLHFDWEVMTGNADERAAQLAQLVLDAAAGDRPWTLRLPDRQLGPASEHAHLHECLAGLATTGLPAGPPP